MPLHKAPGLHRYTRLIISAFIAFHLFALISWSAPSDSPLVSACRRALRPYMLYFSLFHKWDMFAPDPVKLNRYVEAVITYRDGQSRRWTFPRMEELGLIDKYVEERYRKYAIDNLWLDSNSTAWPDAARYVARANNTPANPPVMVTLVRHWSVIPPPDAKIDPADAPWNTYEFVHYAVAPGDLQ